ncbi:MAG: hypothetical protein AB7Y46_05680 [Armatimonadota bacterium]
MTIELGLLLPGLVLLLLGMIELGLFARSVVVLHRLAGEAAQAAAAGAAPAAIDARIGASAGGLRSGTLARMYCRRTPSADGSGQWRPLRGAGETNDAAAGDELMVEVLYPHRLLTGRLLAGIGLATEPVTLSASMVAVRS